MRPLPHPLRATLLLCAPLLAGGLAACGTGVSTSGFKGEQHAVAQTISNLQSDATASNEKKICSVDLANATVARLGGAKRCEKAIKDQLAEIDNLEVKVESIHIDAGGSSATAELRSVYSGKRRKRPVTLVKEGGKWKVSSVQ